MKSNEQLQKDVMEALKWDPQLHAAEIGVIVHEGVVTLTGILDHYAKKMTAEGIVKKVPGVKALIEKIEVVYPSAQAITDEVLAQNVLKALQNHWDMPDQRIQIKVENGCVTLSGDVTWHYQKEAANRLIAHLSGIRRVVNNLKIRSVWVNELEKRIVEKALRHHWAINPAAIEVVVAGSQITLIGSVASLYQKDEAAKIAWKTPGVTQVNNQLTVDYQYEYML